MRALFRIHSHSDSLRKITISLEKIIDNAKNAGYHDIIEVDWQQVA